MQTTLSEVQQTIISQVKANFQDIIAFRAVVHTIVSCDDLTVKFLCDDRNVEVKYNEGMDDYTVTVVTFSHYQSPKITEHKGVYCDEFAQYFSN